MQTHGNFQNGLRTSSPLAGSGGGQVKQRRRSSLPSSFDLPPLNSGRGTFLMQGSAVGSRTADWLAGLEAPLRPASTQPPRTELFSDVVPAARPYTPPPSLTKSMGEVPARPVARKTSEAVAIERIFSNFNLPPTPEPVLEEPLVVPATRPFSPSQGGAMSALLDGDTGFRSDLANVLVWFEQDLTNSQRITTAFTLLNHLTTWQLRFVLSLLSRPSDGFEEGAAGQMLGSLPNAQQDVVVGEGSLPPGFDRPESPVRTETPMRPVSPARSRLEVEYAPKKELLWRSATPPASMAPPAFKNLFKQPTRKASPSTLSGTGTSPSIGASSPSLSLSPSASASSTSLAELTLDQCNPELFARDIPAWLRSLRLHKYGSCFTGLSQADLLALAGIPLEEAEGELERLGVLAQGARRKILRVISTIAAGTRH